MPGYDLNELLWAELLAVDVYHATFLWGFMSRLAR